MSEKKREILFRGKENPSGEWIEGFLVGNCHIGDWVTAIPVHSKTVGQFTGLYDSTKWEALTDAEKMAFYKQHYIAEDGMSVRFQNVDDVKHLWKGKKIFEGDICRVSRPCVITYGHIEFMNGCFWFADYGPGGLLRLCDVRMNGFTIEITGNIHDNPELLKEETDG